MLNGRIRTTAYPAAYSEQLEQLTLRNLANIITAGNVEMLNDLRPVQTVMDGLHAMGLQPMYGQNKEFLLVSQRGHKTLVARISFLRMLYICLELYQHKQDLLKGESFKRMCAEENEEEVELLIEIYRMTHVPVEKAPTPDHFSVPVPSMELEPALPDYLIEY